jgi:hypothetical protein
MFAARVRRPFRRSARGASRKTCLQQPDQPKFVVGGGRVRRNRGRKAGALEHPHLQKPDVPEKTQVLPGRPNRAPSAQLSAFGTIPNRESPPHPSRPFARLVSRYRCSFCKSASLPRIRQMATRLHYSGQDLCGQSCCRVSRMRTQQIIGG